MSAKGSEVGQDPPIQPAHDANSSTLLDLFSNRLISLNILGYLRTSDWKALRLSSKQILASVNRNRAFANNFQFTLCAENESILAGSTLEWKKARVLHGNKPFANYAAVLDCLESVEELELGFTDPPLDDEHMDPKIFAVLELPNLKSLKIHINYIKWFTKYFKEPSTPLEVNICQALAVLTFERLQKSLTGLHIFGSVDPAQYDVDTVSMFGGHQWKLKCLNIDSSDFPRPGISIIAQCISDTVERMQLPSMPGYSIGYLGLLILAETEFPSLRHLKLTSNSHEAEYLATFLAKQHRLQTLQVTCLHKIIPNSVLNAIKDNGAELRELLLSGSHWLESFPNEQQWEFLSDFKKLEKFVMSGKSSATNCTSVINPCIQYLPVGIRSIQLDSANSSRGFDWEARTIRVLETFTKLTELKIENCKRVVNDAVLQSICKTLSRLRIFYLESHEVTDFGISGEKRRGNSSGISLGNLNLLQELTLTKSRRITLAGIKTAVQFLELRELDIRCGAGGLVAGVEDILEIAKRNPSLESINCFTVGKPSLESALTVGRLRSIGAYNFKRTSRRLLGS